MTLFRGGTEALAPTAARRFDALEAMRSLATMLLERIEAKSKCPVRLPRPGPSPVGEDRSLREGEV
jgi:hypothetical protein